MRTIVTRAAQCQVPGVVVFPGRNEIISEDENYRDIPEFLDSLALGAANRTKILIENWPGKQRNFVATTPQGWRKLFSLVKSPNVGLEFDPSHLVWQGINPLQAMTEFRGRILIVHGKDTKLFTDRIQDVGYCGDWWEYRLPGRGELDWGAFLRHLAEGTQSGNFVSIEHEDAEFGWPGGPIALRQEGLLQGLAVLRQSIVANNSLPRV